MSIRKAIYDLLNDTEADVYPFVAPQELTAPYAVYMVRMSPVRTQDGFTTEVDLTLEIYANDLSDCISLADSFNSDLEGTTGTYDTETLYACNWVSESGDYIPQIDKFNITQEYQLRFT